MLILLNRAWNCTVKRPNIKTLSQKSRKKVGWKTHYLCFANATPCGLEALFSRSLARWVISKTSCSSTTASDLLHSGLNLRVVVLAPKYNTLSDGVADRSLKSGTEVSALCFVVRSIDRRVLGEERADRAGTSLPSPSPGLPRLGVQLPRLSLPWIFCTIHGILYQFSKTFLKIIVACNWYPQCVLHVIWCMILVLEYVNFS